MPISIGRRQRFPILNLAAGNVSIMSLASWAGSRGRFGRFTAARWPLGQLVGPPCSCFVPAFNALVADFTIFMVRVLEWAGKDRHSVDGPATGTGIFTAIAGSHAGFGALRGHKGEYAPFGPSRKSFRSLALFKGTHYPIIQDSHAVAVRPDRACPEEGRRCRALPAPPRSA